MEPDLEPAAVLRVRRADTREEGCQGGRLLRIVLCHARERERALRRQGAAAAQFERAFQGVPHVELLRGEVYRMGPIGPKHVHKVAQLDARLQVRKP